MSDEITDPSGALADEENEIQKELAERLPRAGDRLFVESAGGARLDPLGLTRPGSPRDPRGRWQLYAEGFLSAADRLVDSLRGQACEDELIYPILSLFRHHLELQLKWVIRYSAGCTPEIRQWLREKHRLEALWNKLAEVYPRFCAWAGAQTTEACRSLILELDGHDPSSQATRYPEDTQGNQTLTRLEIVDLPTVRLGIHKISHYLSTIVEQIAGDHEWEAEMASWG